MPRMPKRMKFRKQHRGRLRGNATRGNYVARQIEAGRVAAMHFLRREGKVFIRVFPDKPVSKKPLETRMGKGKADTDYWCARVKPGTVLYEVAGVPEVMAKNTLARIAMKMPIRCRAVKRRLSV